MKKKRILKLLQKLFADYNTLTPNYGDEGSISSTKDPASGSFGDDSRNTVDSHGSEEDSYSDNIAAATVKSLLDPAKMGFLEKKQEMLFTTSWPKRYCVLHKNIFYLFKKPGDKKQQGAFYVTGYEVREVPQVVRDEKRKECRFELVCPGKKTYQFLAESKEDLQAWKDVIEAASANVPQAEDETVEDVYEDFSEVEAKQTPKSPEPDDFYTDGTTEVVPPSKTNPIIMAFSSVFKGGLKSMQKSGPVSPNPDPKKSLSAEEDVHNDQDDDGIEYELVENQKSVKEEITSQKKIFESSPPPVPLNVLKVPKASQPLPPLPPQRDDEQPPPVPPQRNPDASQVELPPSEPSRPPIGRSLPPPPTEPLPPVPTTLKKIIFPTLGKILHPKEDFENLFYGKWDCTGSTDNELNFKRGDIVHIISRDLDKDDWWVGALENKIGLVPKNLLTPAYELVH